MDKSGMVVVNGWLGNGEHRGNSHRAQFGIQYLEVAPEVKRYPTKTTFPKKCCVSFESTFREVHRQLYFLSQSRPTVS